MVPRYRITLTADERGQLRAITRSGKASAAEFIHARALLLCDSGPGAEEVWKVADVAAALGISSRSIEYLKKRFVEQGMISALARKPRGKPATITFGNHFDAHLANLASSPVPDGHTRWTVRLLAEKLVEQQIVPTVSLMTVQRSLKKSRSSLS